MALAAITAIVDPEVIILDGSIGRSLQPYLADYAGRLAGRLLAVPRLCISGLGPNATVVEGLSLRHCSWLVSGLLPRRSSGPSPSGGGVKEIPEACYVATPAGSAAECSRIAHDGFVGPRDDCQSGPGGAEFQRRAGGSRGPGRDAHARRDHRARGLRTPHRQAHARPLRRPGRRRSPPRGNPGDDQFERAERVAGRDWRRRCRLRRAPRA